MWEISSHLPEGRKSQKTDETDEQETETKTEGTTLNQSSSGAHD
jgi:hypothetical protein